LTVDAYASFADDNASGNPGSDTQRQVSRPRLRQAALVIEAFRNARPGSSPARRRKE